MSCRGVVCQVSCHVSQTERDRLEVGKSCNNCFIPRPKRKVREVLSVLSLRPYIAGQTNCSFFQSAMKITTAIFLASVASVNAVQTLVPLFVHLYVLSPACLCVLLTWVLAVKRRINPHHLLFSAVAIFPVPIFFYSLIRPYLFNLQSLFPPNPNPHSHPHTSLSLPHRFCC